MTLIELTDRDTLEKFYLQAELIEKINKTNHGAIITLTTGRWVSCAEEPDKVKYIVDKAQGFIESL